MSGARFLDDLARTLAEPMPRRRALRLLGSSLAAVTVPAFAPRVARAVATAGSVKCGYDQRTCRKGAEAQFEEYCCPSPSWQFFCGGQTNAYRCVNQCPTRDNFPCTALIPDREAGRNGVCCDRSIHSGCNPAIRYPKDLKCPEPTPCAKGALSAVPLRRWRIFVVNY